MLSLFTTLFTSRWRWAAAGAALLLVVALAAQGLDYASSWLARRRLTKAAHATDAAHVARAATEPSHRHRFDSSYYTLAGQGLELARTTAKLKRHDDSLSRRLPAAPALPADPPRP